MIITRAKAQPSAWTFKIKPIAALLERTVTYEGAGWIDPFAGYNSPAEVTNDLDPDAPTLWHMEAEVFCRYAANGEIQKNGQALYPFNGVLFDPPYSYRQISEHYRKLGRKATQLDTSANFYNRVMNACCDAIVPGGTAISFGWNSSGFGPNRGFEIVEILLVNHGMSHHNDTICVVEQKVQVMRETA